MVLSLQSQAVEGDVDEDQAQSLLCMVPVEKVRGGESEGGGGDEEGGHCCVYTDHVLSS